MISGAFRISSWNCLRWKDVTVIAYEKNEITAAKIIIYAGEPEEYYCFITPEAFDALNEYINFRKTSGEEITGQSWLVREAPLSRSSYIQLFFSIRFYSGCVKTTVFEQIF
jgi:hypothetical protein